MSGSHFYALVAGWLTGIVFGTSAVVSYSESPLLGIFCSVLLVISFYFTPKFRIPIGMFVLSCTLGFFHASTTVTNFDTIARSTHAVERQGVVIYTTENNTRTRVIVHDINWDLDVRTSLTSDVPEVGDVILYSALLKEPDVFITETGRVFDYKEFSRARNVIFDTKKFEYKIIGTDWYYKKISALYSFRDAVAATLMRTVREPEAGLAVAMLLGIGGTLDESDNRVFREVGLVHIVVLSGFHIMAIFGAMVLLGSFFLPYRSRFIIALCATLLFSVMVGLTPTVIRADIMAVCVAFACILGKGRAPLRALAIAATIITFFAPYALLYDAGFQFSFLATLAIIVVTPIIMLFLRGIPTTFELRAIVAATISIELILTPLISWSMGTLPLIGIFANVLVLPVVPCAMLASLMLWLSSFLFPAGTPLFTEFVTALHGYIIAVARLLHSLPYAYFTIGSYSLRTLGGIYVLVISLILYLAYKRAGMPSKQKSALCGPCVSQYTIETIDDIRAKLVASRQRPS